MSKGNELRFLHWGYRPHCDVEMEKHFVGYHSLQLTTRGQVSITYDDVEHHLGGTCFWFHYPGPYTRLKPGEAKFWEHRHVAFAGPLCKVWEGAELLAQPPLSCPPEQRAEFITRFDQIFTWLDQDGTASLAKARALLEVVLWELWEIRRNPTRRHSVMDAATQFAAEHKFRVGSYEKLASDLGLSLSSLRREVRKTTGMPIHQFTRTLRLREARRLLRHTDSTLAQIADALGFTDVYYFNREFSRLAGISPGAYRQSAF
ncbi:MAG: AraC family transcriptional regulator [Chthoniobacterales bacterium]